MAYKVRVYVDVDWVGEGSGGAGLAGSTSSVGMSNYPSQGIANYPIAVGNAQTMRFQDQEPVGGTLDAPTAANIGAAITAAATDIQTQITAAVLAQIQGWATGGP
jgi:hypothetical protein